MADEKVAIVIDNGSCTTRVGFGGEDAPHVTFPSIVGHPKHYDPGVGKSWLHCSIGDDALVKRNDLDLLHPIKNGIVTDWDEMHWIWDHIFNKAFAAETKGCPVLLTEPPLNPKANREKTTEQVLALYSVGRTTGLAFDIGDGVSHAVPVDQGYSLPRAIVRLELAGRHVTNHLGSLLKHRGCSFTTTDELEILRKIKEQFCYVATDFELELSTADSNTTSYELPDGHCVDVGSERFQAPEYLFRDIVLTGGSSLFSGIQKRMEKEIQSLEVSLRARVSATPECQLASWIGGSILASVTSSSKDMWISKEEYNETGPTVVHLKCFQ
ncbi:hypothetical protein ABFA07_005638 [Porites harrisoni]